MMESLKFSNLQLNEDENDDEFCRKGSSIDPSLVDHNSIGSMISFQTVDLTDEQSKDGLLKGNFGGSQESYREVYDITFPTKMTRSGQSTESVELKAPNERNLSIINNCGKILVDINTEEDKTPITADYYFTPESKIGNQFLTSAIRAAIPSTSRATFDSIRKPCFKSSTKGGKVKKCKRLVQRKLDFPNRKRNCSYNMYNVNINIKDNSGTIVIRDAPIADSTSLREDFFREEDSPDESDGPSSQPGTLYLGKSVTATADELFKERCCDIYEMMNKLHPLRDNGEWSKFHKVIASEQQVARGENKFHIEVLLMIEMSITLCYQKDFERSHQMFEEAKNQLKVAKNFPLRLFLISYLHCHETALNRRNNKSAKARRCTVIAQQNAELVSSRIIKAFAMYENASNLSKDLSLIDVDEPERQEYELECKTALKDCIALCEVVLQEEKSIYLVRHQFALVKLALMNLNCRTKNSRHKEVPSACIQEAEVCINKIENCYKEQLNQAMKIQLFNAKCDLCWRKGELEDANLHAQAALKMAENADWKLEIRYITERLEDINSYPN